MVIGLGNKNYPENYEQLINRREDLWSCGAYDCIFFFSCKDSRKWPNPNVYIINRITFHSSRLFLLQRSNHLIRPILDLWKNSPGKVTFRKTLLQYSDRAFNLRQLPPTTFHSLLPTFECLFFLSSLLRLRLLLHFVFATLHWYLPMSMTSTFHWELYMFVRFFFFFNLNHFPPFSHVAARQ